MDQSRIAPILFEYSCPGCSPKGALPWEGGPFEGGVAESLVAAFVTAEGAEDDERDGRRS